MPNIEVTSPGLKQRPVESSTRVKREQDASIERENSDTCKSFDSETGTQRTSHDGTEDAESRAEPDHSEASETGIGSHTDIETTQTEIETTDNEATQDNLDTDQKTVEPESQEMADTLGQLPHKSLMLEPIPEPDYSDLSDREKLFPRPAISNPTVTYELACRQLGVVPISQYLRSLDTNAEDLRLQSYGLARLDMLPLCHSLAYNTTATSLNLSQNRLLENVLPNIQAMMNDNSFIGSIDLSRNNLTGPGLKSLQVMLSNNYTLTSLNLSHCQLLDSDAPALAAVIEISLNLRSLGLAHNELSECGKLLGGVLADSEGLEALDLSWNTFRSKSAKELLLGLRKNSRLRRLDLAWNSLGPDTAVALRDLLKKNCAIVELDVSHNRLSDNNMKPIGLGLTKNQTLEKLWIGHNPVTPVGALALMRALPKANTKLVDMSQVEVSSDFVKLRDKLDPDAITVIHGTVNKDMVLIVPATKKKRV